MPPRARAAPRPGPFELFGELKYHGAGANYDAHVARGPKGWAVYSPEPEPRRLRYLLGRKIEHPPLAAGSAQCLEVDERRARVEADAVLLFVLLNPSTATEQDNDPTITRTIGYATTWGYSTLWIANAFAHRDTKPANMIRAYKAGVDVVGELNDAAISVAAKHADLVLCGWGSHGTLGGRGARVRELVEAAGAVPHVLRINARTGTPVHPLYQRADMTPQPWPREPAPPAEPEPTEGAPA